MNIRLEDAARAMGVAMTGDLSILIKNVSTDSRTIRNGDLFFALRGDRYDGHSFVHQALEKGACAAVVDREWVRKTGGSDGKRLLAVSDPLTELQALAMMFRKTMSFPVIAVTGTNGKSTTKEMIASILGVRHRVEKSRGNLNNHIGLPLSLCEWEEASDYGVVEMGANHFGEIHRLCTIAQPTHGVITNIGKGHLEFFGDIDGVFRAKSELINYLKQDGTVFLNGDDSLLRTVKSKAAKFFGFSDACDFRGKIVDVDEKGFPRMRIGGIVIRLNLRGDHNLYNALAASSVARSFGIAWAEIREALERYTPMDKRMEVIRLSGIIILNDAYNANPSSMKLALHTLVDFPGVRRRIAVLGDMLELGKVSQEEHRYVGDWIADLKLDAVFCYGEETRMSVKRARERGVMQAHHFMSKDDLISELLEYIEKEDAVLIKGSRGMRMEDVIEGLQMELSLDG